MQILCIDLEPQGFRIYRISKRPKFLSLGLVALFDQTTREPSNSYKHASRLPKAVQVPNHQIPYLSETSRDLLCVGKLPNSVCT